MAAIDQPEFILTIPQSLDFLLQTDFEVIFTLPLAQAMDFTLIAVQVSEQELLLE